MRIFVSSVKGDKVFLEGDSHRHVAYAQRSRVGDKITLCPQDGFDYNGVIEKITSDKTSVKIIEKVMCEGEPTAELDVYFGIPNKGEKLDLIVRKLTELGVHKMIPIVTEFVQANEKSVRLDRLGKICEEAAKQCGRGVIPEVCPPIRFDAVIPKLSEYDLTVFPYEGEKTLSLKEYMSASLAKKSVRKVALIVGSEGGFSPREAEALAGVGISAVTLGKRILRTETANIAVSAVIMYELGEWRMSNGGDSV